MQLNTYRFFQEPKNTDSLQKVIQVVVESGGLVWGVHIGMELLRIRLNQGRLFELGVLIEVPETYPVIECYRARKEKNSE